ncbi:MAG: iron-sulfur cluster assembly scaffold protein [Candidatus Dependentiae bacterium]|nr:iron-sulfur cluster assembly scaffold protein [Candidatus Dependentiae bacterium]
MYQALLHDHYQYPRNKGELVTADFTSYQHNPSCGDLITFQGTVSDSGLLLQVAFNGTGCVISQATASLLSEKAVGMPIGQIQLLDKNMVLQLIGMELGPTRLKCALLPLDALQQGIAEYIHKKRNV